MSKVREAIDPPQEPLRAYVPTVREFTLTRHTTPEEAVKRLDWIRRRVRTVWAEQRIDMLQQESASRRGDFKGYWEHVDRHLVSRLAHQIIESRAHEIFAERDRNDMSMVRRLCLTVIGPAITPADIPTPGQQIEQAHKQGLKSALAVVRQQSTGCVPGTYAADVASRIIAELEGLAK